jgi:ribosome maturation factor RimP
VSDEAAGADPVSAEAVSPTSDLIIGEESSTETSEQMLSPVATKVFELLSPLVATAGVELIDVEWTGGTLRVVLDHPEGVTTETLTAVNRLISPLLDQHDPVPGRYTLEVSSPGVERPLRRLEHFRRAVGEDVVIKTVASVEPRRFRGALRSVAETEIVIDAMEIDGVEVSEPEPRTVAVADISTARTVFDWGPAPKVGPKQGPSKKSGPKSTKTHRKPEQQHSQRKAKRSAGNRGDRSGATGSAASTSGEEETAGQSESAQNRKEVGDE